MRFSKQAWSARTLDGENQLHGVRILARASFVVIAVCATIGNAADQEARQRGLISVHIAVPSLMLGAHSCMQPEPEDVPAESVPEKPPCPKDKLRNEESAGHSQ